MCDVLVRTSVRGFQMRHRGIPDASESEITGPSCYVSPPRGFQFPRLASGLNSAQNWCQGVEDSSLGLFPRLDLEVKGSLVLIRAVEDRSKLMYADIFLRKGTEDQATQNKTGHFQTFEVRDFVLFWTCRVSAEITDTERCHPTVFHRTCSNTGIFILETCF